MFYNEFKSPAIIKTGNNILSDIDSLLKSSHLYFPKKILVTQENLYNIYSEALTKNSFSKVILVKGGTIDEAPTVIEQVKDTDAIILAFGGGSVLDIVKYSASKCDMPYITMPSTLSNDAVYSCVSRLTVNGKKTSFGVQPPTGIIVDLSVIKKSPEKLILAGVADLVSNLSALKDWKLGHNDNGEEINELAFMLGKEAALPLLRYKEKDIFTDEFLFDLTNSIITSGLAMIIGGNTRMTSGAEHMISHAIDEYFPEKSSIHGLQVGWAHLIIEKKYRGNDSQYDMLKNFFDGIGLTRVISENVPWKESDFESLIPYARKIRKRYTVFNKLTI